MRLHRAAAGPALRQAAITGSTEQAAVVSDKCPTLLGDALSLRGVLGEAPIHVAASSGHSAVLQMLLDAKANPNAQDLAGETPLHYCAIAGQATTAEMLLKNGADPTIESFFSETAMDVAQQELAYWLVDTAGVQSVLTQTLNDGEKRAVHEAFSKQMQQKQLKREGAISKHKQDCQQSQAVVHVDTTDVQSVLGSRAGASEAAGCSACGELKAELAQSNGQIAALMAEQGQLKADRQNGSAAGNWRQWQDGYNPENLQSRDAFLTANLARTHLARTTILERAIKRKETEADGSSRA